MHSWRVLILPFMEQHQLYGLYRFDEPWDGPNNSKLHKYGLPYNKCAADDPTGPEKSDTETSYLVVVGPQTAFPGDICTALSDITDDKGNTILVVEVQNSGIHWMEPRDLHVTQMARRINAAKGQGISSKHRGGANVLMADDSVQFLNAELTAGEIQSLLSIAGKEPSPDDRSD
jgi:prepilin-type processing-associated H-X9-DG protein